MISLCTEAARLSPIFPDAVAAKAGRVRASEPKILVPSCKIFDPKNYAIKTPSFGWEKNYHSLFRD